VAPAIADAMAVDANANAAFIDEEIYDRAAKKTEM